MRVTLDCWRFQRCGLAATAHRSHRQQRAETVAHLVFVPRAIVGNDIPVFEQRNAAAVFGLGDLRLQGIEEDAANHHHPLPLGTELPRGFGGFAVQLVEQVVKMSQVKGHGADDLTGVFLGAIDGHLRLGRAGEILGDTLGDVELWGGIVSHFGVSLLLTGRARLGT